MRLGHLLFGKESNGAGVYQHNAVMSCAEMQISGLQSKRDQLPHDAVPVLRSTWKRKGASPFACCVAVRLCAPYLLEMYIILKLCLACFLNL